MPQLLFRKEGSAVVIGAPRRFDILASLSKANEIRLATAFSHMSGWELIEQSCLGNDAKVRILTGLDFCQTEPKVLTTWLNSSLEMDLNARLFIGQTSGNIFHPKVFIVKGEGFHFTLTGSGNLSAGGLKNNVECFLYSDRKSVVDAAESWFDSIFQNDHKSCPITQKDIAEYRQDFNVNKKKLREIYAKQRSISNRIGQRHRANLEKMNEAIRKAKEFFSRKGFKADLKAFEEEVATFRSLLDYPHFAFDKKDGPRLTRFRP